VILNLKEPENSTKKLLDIISSFSKVARYKINLQKSVALQYNNNEEKYGKIIPFAVASKN
jgi:hypothetical protein